MLNTNSDTFNTSLQALVYDFLKNDNDKVKLVTDRRHMFEKNLNGGGGWGRPGDILWSMQNAQGAPDTAWVIPNRMYFNGSPQDMAIIFDPNTDPEERKNMIKNGHKLFHFSKYSVPFTGTVLFKSGGKEPAEGEDEDDGPRKRKRESVDGELRRREYARRNGDNANPVFTLHELAHHSHLLTDLIL